LGSVRLEGADGAAGLFGRTRAQRLKTSGQRGRRAVQGSCSRAEGRLVAQPSHRGSSSEPSAGRAAMPRANGGSTIFISFLYQGPGVPLEFICAQQHIAHIGSNDPARRGDGILTDWPQNRREPAEDPQEQEKGELT